MPRSKFMLAGLLALGIAAALTAPALAGDFDVRSATAPSTTRRPRHPRPRRPIRPETLPRCAAKSISSIHRWGMAIRIIWQCIRRPEKIPSVIGGQRMSGKHFAVGLAALAAALIASCPALASVGCSNFYGMVNDRTKGEGGKRVGHGFSKGDTLTVTIHQAPDQMKETANLLQYASPDGPFRALTEDTSERFTYTVPASTSDFIYLNFGGVLRGVVVTWGCTPGTKF